VDLRRGIADGRLGLRRHDGAKLGEMWLDWLARSGSHEASGLLAAKGRRLTWEIGRGDCGYNFMLVRRGRDECHQLRRAGKLNRTDEQATGDCGEQGSGALWPERGFAAQNAMDAAGQFRTALPGAERQRFGAVLQAAFGEPGKAGGVGAGSMGGFNHAFVAGHFAFNA